MAIDRDALLIAQAQEQLDRLGIGLVRLNLKLETTIALIGFAQLGLKHPEAAKTASAIEVRALIDQATRYSRGPRPKPIGLVDVYRDAMVCQRCRPPSNLEKKEILEEGKYKGQSLELRSAHHERTTDHQ